MASSSIAQKIWSYCDTLRDDGMSYGDYLEQITHLLFLKMAYEQSQNSVSKKLHIPKGCDWESLMQTNTNLLIQVYNENLKRLSEAGGMLSKIFTDTQNKIQDSHKLRKLIELINEEHWMSESVDIKGEIYESLLQKNAENSGAGQYFTPRPVIQAMVECMRPDPMLKIADPSCGTGGFFLGVLSFIRNNHKKLSERQQNHLKYKAFHGWEIVPATARLCLMNLFLHGLGDLQTTPKIDVIDSLKDSPKEKVDMVFANPPFGKTSSDVATNDKGKAKQDGYYLRNDFWVTTSNKQLAFLQHIFNMLNSSGQAAIVLPDNVLFEGGAGETVRRKLLQKANLHTILRLPTGIFYANGVKANVIFFDAIDSGKSIGTNELWIYDYRTNVHHTLKKNPLNFEDLKDFINCFMPLNRQKRKETWSINNPNGRWRKFKYEEIIARDKASLDIAWIQDKSHVDLDTLRSPEKLAASIVKNLEAGLADFREILSDLHNNE